MLISTHIPDNTVLMCFVEDRGHGEFYAGFTAMPGHEQADKRMIAGALRAVADLMELETIDPGDFGPP